MGTSWSINGSQTSAHVDSPCAPGVCVLYCNFAECSLKRQPRTSSVCAEEWPGVLLVPGITATPKVNTDCPLTRVRIKHDDPGAPARPGIQNTSNNTGDVCGETGRVGKTRIIVRHLRRAGRRASCTLDERFNQTSVAGIIIHKSNCELYLIRRDSTVYDSAFFPSLGRVI